MTQKKQEKPIRKSLKSKMHDRKEATAQFLKKVAEDELSLGKFHKKLVNAVKVFIVSTRKFLKDDCLTKASSISYTTIVSLIPTLAVALTFYYSVFSKGGGKDELFRKISLFLLENNIQLDVNPIFSTLSGLIDNAGKIGGISAAIMIFSATAMLRSLEKSLNDIWKVKKQRPIFLKVVYYWAALTLGPIMLVAGTAVATKLTDAFSSPHYYAAQVNDNKTTWIVGSKAKIMQSSVQDKMFVNKRHRNIDFNNQKSYSFDKETATYSLEDTTMEPFEFKKTTFLDIQFIGKKGWITGKNGVLLLSTNGGKSWALRKFANHTLKDIHMFSASRGILLTGNGYILTTENGGWTWTPGTFYEKGKSFQTLTAYKNSIIITATRGFILLSSDGGKTWENRIIPAAKRKGREVMLQRPFFVNGSEIWIPCSEGVLLKSRDKGITWSQIIFKETNYYSALFKNSKEGFIAGDKGRLIYTADGGKSWQEKSISTSKINRLYKSNSTLIAIGDRGLILTSINNGKSWSGTEGKSFILILFNFFAPFVFIWAMFLLAYSSMPNIRVPFKYAATGAAFTGAVWVLFILLFIYYVKGFAVGTFAIYGALAAIPLFLLMVYASSVITLYGAEVSYTLMHPESYRKLKKAFQDKKEIQVYFAIAMLERIYSNFESGKGPTYFKELMKATANNADDIDFFARIFLKKNIIIQDGSGGYLPATSSEKVLVADIIDMAHSVGMDIPGYTKSSPMKNNLQKIFNQVQAKNREVLREKTLKDLMA